MYTIQYINTAICVVLPVELDKITSESSHSWVWMLQLFFSPSLKSLIDGCKNERRNPPLKSSINLSNKSGSRHLQWIQVTLLLMLVVLSCHKLLISSIKLFNICNKSRVYNIWRDLSQDDDHIWWWFAEEFNVEFDKLIIWNFASQVLKESN